MTIKKKQQQKDIRLQRAATLMKWLDKKNEMICLVRGERGWHWLAVGTSLSSIGLFVQVSTFRSRRCLIISSRGSSPLRSLNRFESLTDARQGSCFGRLSDRFALGDGCFEEGFPSVNYPMLTYPLYVPRHK